MNTEPATNTERRSLADRIRTNNTSSGTSLDRQFRLLDTLVQGFFFVCGAISILTTIGFVIVLGSEAMDFFTSTAWLEGNKGIVDSIDAEQTEFLVETSGSPLEVGQVLRLGIADDDEEVRILSVGEPLEDGDEVSITVERGVRDTETREHNRNEPIYIADDVTFVEFFTETQWAPQIGAFGILPLLSATLRVAFIAMIVSVPLGLMAAIYLSEYAAPVVRATLKPILEILAGIPTVVYGYFALTFVTPLLRDIFGTNTVSIYNVLSAGIVVGVLIIPTISSISEDALSAVPESLRRASYGMGATRLETIRHVLIPSALSGITAAIILGISRAVGETMIVLIAAGAGPKWTFNPFESAETMAGHIARISTGDLSRGSIDYNSLFAVGLTLFIMTLILNFVSTLITRRFREVYA